MVNKYLQKEGVKSPLEVERFFTQKLVIKVLESTRPN